MPKVPGWQLPDRDRPGLHEAAGKPEKVDMVTCFGILSLTGILSKKQAF